MALLLAGIALIALGLFCGVVLLLAPLSLVPWAANTVLWLLFPLLSVVGYAVFVVGARRDLIRSVSIGISLLHLVLAIAAATALVMHGVNPAGEGTGLLSVWYVLMVAGLIGATGAASFRRPEQV